MKYFIIGATLTAFGLFGCGKRGINEYVDRIEWNNKKAFKRYLEKYFAEHDVLREADYYAYADGSVGQKSSYAGLKIIHPRFAAATEHPEMEPFADELAKAFWQQIANKDQYFSVVVWFVPERYPNTGKDGYYYKKYAPDDL